MGPYAGFGNQAVTGVVGSGRLSRVAGVDIELDFNRVSNVPDRHSTNPEDLKFIPNIRVAGVFYTRRLNTYSFFLTGGVGFDLQADYNRSNMFTGVGIEFVFLRGYLTFSTTLRYFFPKPSDVEYQRELISMEGETPPSFLSYYFLDNYQLHMVVRWYY